jgi:hypothetical protein
MGAALEKNKRIKVRLKRLQLMAALVMARTHPKIRLVVSSPSLRCGDPTSLLPQKQRGPKAPSLYRLRDA